MNKKTFSHFHITKPFFTPHTSPHTVILAMVLHSIVGWSTFCFRVGFWVTYKPVFSMQRPSNDTPWFLTKTVELVNEALIGFLLFYTSHSGDGHSVHTTILPQYKRGNRSGLIEVRKGNVVASGTDEGCYDSISVFNRVPFTGGFRGICSPFIFSIKMSRNKSGR